METRAQYYGGMVDEQSLKAQSQQSYLDHLERLGHDRLTPALVAGLDAWYQQVLPSDPGIKVLDFGCGAGDFLEYLKHKGFSDVQGCDHNQLLVEYAQKRSDCPVTRIEDLSQYVNHHHQSFDLIHLKDVLEHIPKAELSDFLISLGSMLKPRGTLLVSCPQMSGFTSLYTLFDDITHVTLFTENSLKMALKSAGYESLVFLSASVALPSIIHFRGGAEIMVHGCETDLSD